MNAAVSLDPNGALMVAHEVAHLDELVEDQAPAGRPRHPLARQLYVAHLALEQDDPDHAAEMLRRAADALEDDQDDATEVQADA